MQSYIIEKNQAGQRLDKFLHKYLPNASTSFLYKMLRKKNITLNGKKAEGMEILQINDEIKCFFSEETFARFAGNTISTESVNGIDVSGYEKAFKDLGKTGISVVYEDENVLVLNKPAGVLTQRAESKEASLNEWMIGYLLNSKKISASELRLFKPSVLNRLDRNTSGLVLCGISLAGSQALSEIIRTRAVKKFYRTICVGELKEAATLTGSLSKNHKTNTVIVNQSAGNQASIKGDAENIQTAFTPIRALGNKYTYLEVELITGKTHQIRAHLASIGHALIGDTKYGNPAVNSKMQKDFKLRYQLLHAYRLEFPQMKGALSNLSKKVLIAPLPNTFENILKELS